MANKSIIIAFLLVIVSISYKLKDRNSNQIIDDSLQIFEVSDQIQTVKITVTERTIFYLKFRGNPSTGYKWFLDNKNSLDNRIVKFQNLASNGSSLDFAPDPNPKALVGIAGYYYFKIQAIAKGNQQLSFGYRRQPKILNEKIISVTLNIVPQ